MKTLHLTNSYHETSGGISTFYRALFRSAEESGRRMTLIAPGAETRTEEWGEFGRIHYIKSPASPFFDRRYRMIWPTSYALPFASKLRSILSAEQPDLVEIGDKYSLCWLAGMIRRRWIPGIGRPVLVGTSHERMDDNIGAFVTRHQSGELSRCGIRYYLGRLYLPLFDHHFANSQYTADELLDATVSGHERPVEVMPMGAEVREFLGVAPSESSRRALMASVGINATRPSVRTLLYVGRLSPEKNMGLLIDLMERLSSDAANEYHLLIAGDGPLLDHLGSEGQRRAPGRVHLLGHISDRSRIIELYHNSDIFVHPNPREPFGIAPLEAMAAGLPIVAPRSGGLLSYASDSNAWLCEPNAENYATAIRSITADPVRREERVALARATASRYRWSDVTARFETRFEELCRGFSAARIGNQGEQIQ